MRPLSCFALALTALAATACVGPESADESSTSSDVTGSPRSSAFVLTVSSDENGVTVVKPDGTMDNCPDFESCQFAYIAGTTVSLSTRGNVNPIDCLRFNHWNGACAGQGFTCTLTINSDLSADAAWSFIRGCAPK